MTDAGVQRAVEWAATFASIGWCSAFVWVSYKMLARALDSAPWGGIKFGSLAVASSIVGIVPAVIAFLVLVTSQ